MRTRHKVIPLVLMTLALVIVGIWKFPSYLKSIYDPVEEYDYVIFQDGTTVKAKNGRALIHFLEV
jgi:hypothetical protein